MVRNTENLTISIPKEMGKQIEALDLKPSKIFQQALDEIIEKSKGRMELIKANEHLSQTLQKYMQALTEFLDHKHIDITEFNQFVFASNKRKADGLN